MNTKMLGELMFPAEEKHFLQYLPNVHEYQKAQRDYALRFVKDFWLCLDIGAHVGIFSRHFAQHFATVLAFEPIANLRECLRHNVPQNVEIVAKAVSDHCGSAKMLKQSTVHSGCSFISNDPRIAQPMLTKEFVDAEVITIDSLNLDRVGLIKIDIQGADHLAILGATETIKRCRPVLLVEEKPVGGPGGSTQHIHNTRQHLISLGMQPMLKVGADRTYYFP
jgi:FkbM family methyltransferase